MQAVCSFLLPLETKLKALLKNIMLMAPLGAIFLSIAQAQTPLPVVSGTVAGETAGSFEVSPLGAATYTIPLRVAPGIAGVQPQLSIAYSSSSGQGYLGEGFALTGLSMVSRCPSSAEIDGYRDPVDFDQSDRFCIDGQRMVVVQGTFSAPGSRYRTTSESFSDITAVGQYGTFSYNGYYAPLSFTSKAKNGLSMEFGGVQNARVEAAGPAEIASWLLNKVSDRVGNYYQVSYSRDVAMGEAYPTRIDYTGNASQGVLPNNAVIFEYEDQSYPINRYLGGRRFSVTKRISKIRMQAAGSDIWEYRFAYAFDDTKMKTLLTSISECDPNGTCLQPTTFGWGSAAQGVSYTAMATIPDLTVANGYTDTASFPIFFGDWNGDGRTDIGRGLGQQHKFYVANSSGAGFNLFGSVNLAFSGSASNLPAVTGDWNGDGLTDVARLRFAQDQNEYVVQPTGTGLAVNQLSLPNWTGSTSGGRYGLVGDWDGDGKSDVLKLTASTAGNYAFYTPGGNPVSQGAAGVGAISYSNTCDVGVCPWGVGDWNGDGLSDFFRLSFNAVEFFVATGSSVTPFQGFTLESSFSSLTQSQGYNSLSTWPIFEGDWNGDGLTDFGRVTPSGVTLCKSKGAAVAGQLFETCQNTPILSPSQGYVNDDVHPVVVGDWNGDGTTDIGRVGPSGVHLYLVTDGVPHSPVVINDLSPAQGVTDKSAYPVFTGDFNGDGFTDIGRVTPSGVKVYTRSYSQTDALEKITNSLGLQTDIEYRKLTDPAFYTRPTTYTFPNVAVVPTGLFVSRVTTSDQITNSQSVRYRYEGFRVNQATGETDFAKVVATDETSGLVTRKYFDQGQYYGGSLFKTEIWDGNTLLYRNQDSFGHSVLGASRVFNYISATDTQTYELDGTLLTSEQKSFSYDPYGNLLQSVLTRSDGSTNTVINTYNNDATNWRIGQLLTAQVTLTPSPSQSPAPSNSVRQTSFTYEPSTGLLSTETIEPNSTTHRVTKSYTHDSFGNILQTTVQAIGLAALSAHVTYDARGQFVVTSTNQLGQSDTRVTDPRYGKLSQITDSNGLVQSYQYDAFGRQTLVTNPDGTKSRSLYLLAPQGSPVGAQYIIRRDVSGRGPEIGYFDSWGRGIREESTGFSGERVFVDKLYDDEGNVTHVSDPYFQGGKLQWAIYEYDRKNRVVRETMPGRRQLSSTYAGLTVTKTNPLGQTVTTTVDVQGRPIRVVDTMGNSIEYAYDTLGNVIYSRDDDWNETTIAYDIAGHKTQLSTPDSGLTTYIYNALGQLVNETNSKGETIIYGYDDLGRLVQRQLPEGTEIWVFDSTPHGIGQLAVVYGLNNFGESYGYDSLGRLSVTNTNVDGHNFSIGQNYDSNGRLKDTIYPGGFTVRTTYNSAGFPAEIWEATSGSVIWDGVSRNARGQLTRQKLGNGLATTVTYDSLTGFVASKKTGQVQDLEFKFNALGNLTRREDKRIGLSEDVIYDSLNRLSQTTVVGSSPITVTYDHLGNISSRSDVGTYTYNNVDGGPHAVTSIVGPRANIYDYDNAGNRYSSSTGTLEYYSSGQVSAIEEGARRIEFLKNPANDRVLESRFQNGNWLESKVMINQGALEQTYKANGQVVRKIYVSSPDGLVAEFTRNITPSSPAPGRFSPYSARFVLTDNLGSVQTVTSDAGAIQEVLSFDAWGQRRDPYTWTASTSPLSSVMTLGFTSHEQLDDVKLIHMNGRIYDPVIGRFVSADPFIQDPFNTQSWVRYSYVLNNPLTLTDPTGYFSFKKWFKKLRSAVIAVVKLAAITVARAIGATVGFTLGGPIGSAIGSHLFSSFVSSLLSGQSIGESFKMAFLTLPIGLADIGFSSGIHDIFKEGGAVANFFGKFADLAHAAAHGLKSAALYAKSGGNFVSNFASGFAGSYAGSLAAGRSFEFGLAVSSTFGAIASSVAGGWWEDGALQGSLIYLHNHAADRLQDEAVWFYNAVVDGFVERHPVGANCSAFLISSGLALGSAAAGVTPTGYGSKFLELVGLVFNSISSDSTVDLISGHSLGNAQEGYINGNQSGTARPKINRYPSSFQRRANVAKFAALAMAPTAAEYGAKCATNIYIWSNQ